VSGALVNGGDVTDFKWAADSSAIAYKADQSVNDVIELFASLPDGSKNAKISGSLIAGGEVFEFEWVP
jgi:hypothetical protein